VKYDALIDDETWAFIRATEAHYAPDASSLSVEEQRVQYDSLCAAFDRGRPDGVEVVDRIVRSVPIRTYQAAKADSTLLYVHGGGFVLGSLDSHDSICAELCARCECDVISVDYRLAPEHNHPAAYDDVLSVTRWALTERDGPLALAGDSAGATLVASVTHALRSQIAGQILIYPYLGGDMNAGSYLIHADAPLLSRADMLFYEGIRYDGPPPKNDVSFAPLHEADYIGLPPTVVFTAECDPLCDDGDVYCDRITHAGGSAVVNKEKGLVHGYLRARHTVSRARNSFTQIVNSVKAIQFSSD